MFLQSEYFTKLLELYSLRNGSRLVVNMAIMIWLVFHNSVVFLLGLYSTDERKHAAFGFLNLISLKMMFLSSIHLPENDKISFFVTE
jgi:hypothetical protein